MEQVLGHTSWSQNLRRAVEAIQGVEARWVETSLFDPDGLIERLPGIPPYLRASARALVDLRRGLRGWPYDVLFFNTQKPAALCQWQMRRTPTMLMTDVTPLQYDRMATAYEHRVGGHRLVQMLKHQTNVLNFHLARAVIPWSNWARTSLIDEYHVPPERIHVIPPGVDTDYWAPPPERPKNPKVRLLFVGGNFERKGGALLLDVFRSLRLEGQAELHVVTRDVLEPSPGVFVHRSLQNNSLELLRLYQQADVFVLPTSADCFSNASIEAMATGLPVITTSVGGIPDIVEDGRTGYLVTPGDATGLGVALRRLVDDPLQRRVFGGAGRRRASERFDARTNAARILELARRLVTEP